MNEEKEKQNHQSIQVALRNMLVESMHLLFLSKELTREIPDIVTTNLEKAMVPHSITLAWKIPWTEKPGRLPSMGSRRVRHE